MIISSKIQTVYLLVGPSSCGKSYFSTNYLISRLKRILLYNNLPHNIQYLSSDEIRRDLLGDKSISKMDHRMMQVSGPAFEALDARLKAVTSFPINAPFVVVDTTSLNEDFRNKIAKLVKEQNYNLEVILFDYTDQNDYYRLLDQKEVTSREIVEKHLRKFNDSKGHLKQKFGSQKHVITTNHFENLGLEFDISNISEYKATQLSNDCAYTIVGDIHGCLDELQELLRKNGFNINNGIIEFKENHRIVLVGDLLDKGYNAPGVIDFVYNNQEMITVVKGNHENFNWKLLTGQLINPDQEFIKKYITSSVDLASNSVMQKQFLELFDKMVPFAQNQWFIVTHAPCRSAVLGKFSNDALKQQRNEIYPRYYNYFDRGMEVFVKAVEEHFRYLKEEANWFLPKHVFGHVASQKVIKIGNKVGLDTGCVYSGKLTSVTINSIGDCRYYDEVHAGNKIVNEKGLPEFFAKGEK